MPKPYDKTTHDGKTVDWITKAALMECERRLAYPLTIVQGSYHKGVSASAGTHDGGGCVDLAPWDWQNKVKVLREVGFAVWHRTALPGVWGEHIHGVLIGNEKLAPVAARQVTSYFNKRDGLAGNRVDNTWRPDPIPTFKWTGAPEMPRVQAPAAVKGGLTVHGVDLSHHNAVTLEGLRTAQAAGCLFVYHKTTEGTGMRDSTYAQRRDWCQQLGLPFGGYHFARPSKGEDGATEARYFLAAATPKPGDLAPMLDLEDDGGLSKGALTTWVGEWVAEVERATGHKPIVYTPFDLGNTFGCPLWVARYSNANTAPKIPAPWTAWSVRQFSNGVYGKPNRFPGLPPVDLNTVAGDPADLIRSLMLGDDDVTPADFDKIQAMLDAQKADVLKLVESTVAKYVGDVVPRPGVTDDTKNPTWWAKNAIGDIWADVKALKAAQATPVVIVPADGEAPGKA